MDCEVFSVGDGMGTFNPRFDSQQFSLRAGPVEGEILRYA
jgi:hypothetical protein